MNSTEQVIYETMRAKLLELYTALYGNDALPQQYMFPPGYDKTSQVNSNQHLTQRASSGIKRLDSVQNSHVWNVNGLAGLISENSATPQVDWSKIKLNALLGQQPQLVTLPMTAPVTSHAQSTAQLYSGINQNTSVLCLPVSSDALQKSLTMALLGQQPQLGTSSIPSPLTSKFSLSAQNLSETNYNTLGLTADVSPTVSQKPFPMPLLYQALTGSTETDLARTSGLLTEQDKYEAVRATKTSRKRALEKKRQQKQSAYRQRARQQKKREEQGLPDDTPTYEEALLHYLQSDLRKDESLVGEDLHLFNPRGSRKLPQYVSVQIKTAKELFLSNRITGRVEADAMFESMPAEDRKIWFDREQSIHQEFLFELKKGYITFVPPRSFRN